MKMINYLLVILTAGILALTGCGKEKAPPLPPGVVDFGPLQAAFPTPSPEIMTSLQKIRMSARYRQFDAAAAELEALKQAPDLNDAQKKAVADAIEKVKVASTQVPANPAQ